MNNQQNALPLSAEVLARTPLEILLFLQQLQAQIADLILHFEKAEKSADVAKKRVKELKEKPPIANRNSSKPPSSYKAHRTRLVVGVDLFCSLLQGARGCR
jgi:hypothetical protein